jgi:methylsterol monooxygenase
MTEHLFSNLLPNVIGALIVPHHWSQYVFAFTFLEIGTIQAHSGYYIPGFNSPLQHDFHHFAFTENFGPIGLMDTVYGTNLRYRKTLAEAKQNNNGSEVLARLEVLTFLAQREVEESEALEAQNKKAA